MDSDKVYFCRKKNIQEAVEYLLRQDDTEEFVLLESNEKPFELFIRTRDCLRVNSAGEPSGFIYSDVRHIADAMGMEWNDNLIDLIQATQDTFISFIKDRREQQRKKAEAKRKSKEIAEAAQAAAKKNNR